MFFSPTRPVREFSLAELVDKINELERRQRDVGPPPGTPERRRDRRDAAETDSTRDGHPGGEPELTE